MNQCTYITGDKMDTCKMKTKYGSYCSKHKHHYLLDEDSNIIIDRFTNKSSDYLKSYLVRFYEDHNSYKKNLIKRVHKKQLFFDIVSSIIQKYKSYEVHEKEIIKIQSIIRRYICNEIHKTLHRICNNNEDFYQNNNYT